jgi:hypothetical protein
MVKRLIAMAVLVVTPAVNAEPFDWVPQCQSWAHLAYKVQVDRQAGVSLIDELKKYDLVVDNSSVSDSPLPSHFVRRNNPSTRVAFYTIEHQYKYPIARANMALTQNGVADRVIEQASSDVLGDCYGNQGRYLQMIRSGRVGP